MKNLLKNYIDYPQNELEEKWLMVGFLSGLFLLIIAASPIFIILSQLKSVVYASITWYALLIGILIWCFSVFFTVKYWTRFILNISLLFYLSDKKKKANKTK